MLSNIKNIIFYWAVSKNICFLSYFSPLKIKNKMKTIYDLNSAATWIGFLTLTNLIGVSDGIRIDKLPNLSYYSSGTPPPL